MLLVLTRDLFALSEQQNVSISTDIERRAGLSAIAEHLVKQPVVVIWKVAFQISSVTGKYC